MPDFPNDNKMVTETAAKKPYHFSGDGIYHNLTIFAEDLEQATKQWLAKRALLNQPQSTPAPETGAEGGV